ncbi:hypothetical protein B0H14DRAFT_2642101 [Mycena olivaceomarginata]|nr:hypothetical protein B0H14DRAFT_2642101 [Mycena olivaceomarginata]
MDDDPAFEPTSATESAFDENGPHSASFVLQSLLVGRGIDMHLRYTGAFFTNAHHFTVPGGTFNSITNIHHAAPGNPPDYRTISIGNLNLLKEIKSVGASAVVRRRKGRAALRRMYSVRIHGSHSTMTAVLYEDEGAEQMPYMLRFFMTVDLMPHKELRKKYRNSHFSEVYFVACMTSQYHVIPFMPLSDGCTAIYPLDLRYETGQSISQIIALFAFDLGPQHWSAYTVWIRLSMGQLCIDLTPPESWDAGLAFLASGAGPSGTLLDPLDTTEIISSIPNRNYHDICGFSLCLTHWFSVSSEISVQLGSIRHFPTAEYENSFEIAVVSDHAIFDGGWQTEDPDIGETHPLHLKT